jgi:endo-1,4-beta-xylanase
MAQKITDRLISILLGTILLLWGCGKGEAGAALHAEARQPGLIKTSLRTLCAEHGLWIGAAVDGQTIENDPALAGLLANQFNSLTPENALKFGPLRPSPEVFDFAEADSIVAFGRDHAMQVRGHALVWSNQLPDWLLQGEWSRAELTEILQTHISSVVGRYRGQIAWWDVVNEAVDEQGNLAETIWSRGIGPEYIALVFTWAHAADPQAKLFYNDFGGEGMGPKSDGIYRLVEKLLADGVPIHGVGLQFHAGLGWLPDPQEVAANLERLAALGLEVHITEMDVRLQEPVRAADLHAQAAAYSDILRVCLQAENCTAFTLWGATDRYSWIPYTYPGWGSALIFDEDYQPKPAYDALIEVLAGR